MYTNIYNLYSLQQSEFSLKNLKQVSHPWQLNEPPMAFHHIQKADYLSITRMVTKITQTYLELMTFCSMKMILQCGTRTKEKKN